MNQKAAESNRCVNISSLSLWDLIWLRYLSITVEKFGVNTVVKIHSFVRTVAVDNSPPRPCNKPSMPVTHSVRGLPSGVPCLFHCPRRQVESCAVAWLLVQSLAWSITAKRTTSSVFSLTIITTKRRRSKGYLNTYMRLLSSSIVSFVIAPVLLSFTYFIHHSTWNVTYETTSPNYSIIDVSKW